MTEIDPSNLDAADIDADAQTPPEGWEPSTVDAVPDPADVLDKDQESDQ